jgi:phage shock protein C
MHTKLFRSQHDRMIGGVCGGLAEYFAIDSTIVRLVFAVSILFFGVSPLLYIILWILMPPAHATAPYPTLPPQQQDPTGEWQYDPYTGQPIQRHEDTH